MTSTQLSYLLQTLIPKDTQIQKIEVLHETLKLTEQNPQGQPATRYLHFRQTTWMDPFCAEAKRFDN